MNTPDTSALWKHMNQDHNIPLTISQENDIRHAADNDREMQLVTAQNALADALSALRRLVDWGREHISPAHDTEGHAALVFAYDALTRHDCNQP